MLECCEAETERVLIPQVKLADTFWTRFKGLLGTPELSPEQALLIRPCNSVHTLGMRFEIGVVFLDPAGQIMHLIPRMPPQRLSPIVRRAKQVLELNPDRLAELQLNLGMQLLFKPMKKEGV